MSVPYSQIPIVRTKIYVPQQPAGHIPRPRLQQQLDLALDAPLTLVSAPAGYGKSVAVGDWVREQQVPVVWLSLDEEESDLWQFLAYFLAAVGEVQADAITATQALLTRQKPPELKQLVHSFIENIERIEIPLAIVLDDYHLINHASPVHDFLGEVLKHPLLNLHLVLLTRRDPPLPLARMRARNQLVEVRLEDLRFRLDETVAVMNANDLTLGDEQTSEILQSQMEGWAAGLRMVILALPGVEDQKRFLNSMSRGMSQVRDFLLQEALAGLDLEKMDFLLRSAVPGRFCSDLLEALCDQKSEDSAPGYSASQFVEFAYQNNLFTVALDSTGKWFRYHHLFREFLLNQLHTCYRDMEIEDMHARASTWFDDHEYRLEAIIEALAGENVAGAAGIIEKHRIKELDEDRWYILRSWLKLMPKDIRHARADLLLAEAWTTYYRFDLEKLYALVALLEGHEEQCKLDEEQAAELDFFRSFLAYWQGDSVACSRFIERAASIHLRRGMISGEIALYLGLARQMCGDTSKAIHSLESGIRLSADHCDSYATRVNAGMCYVSSINLDPTQTLRSAKRLESIAKKFGSDYAIAWANYMFALVHFNQHDFPQARACFSKVAQNSFLLEERLAFDSSFGVAICSQLLDEPEATERSVKEIQDLVQGLDNLEYSELLASGLARLALLKSDVETAHRLCGSFSGRPPAENLFLWLETPVLTRIRVDIARQTQSTLAAALHYLAELKAKVEAQHLHYRIVDILVLESLAHEKLGDRATAMERMEQAVRVAAPANWQRPFFECGEAILPLLHALDPSGPEQGFLQRICAAIMPEPGEQAGKEASPQQHGGSELPIALETLTNRELDILELLSERYRNKEIASRLFISTHTVNYHLKHVYQKLGVNGRREAVSKGVQIGLLPASR